MKPSFITDMPEEDYHARKELSRSAVHDITKCPRKFWHRYINPNRPKNISSPAMVVGSLVHSMVLEPEKPIDVLIGPTKTRTSKAWQEMEEANPGAYIVNQDEMDMCKYVQDAVWAHERAASLLTGNGVAESTMLWEWSKEIPVNVRARADWINYDRNVMVDLKTTKSASDWSFANSCRDYAYDMQVPFYSAGYQATTGREPNDFLFIAVEKTAPYCVAVYNLEPEAIENARRLIEQGLKTYQYYKVNDFWPDYNNGEVKTLSVRRF